MSKEKLKKKRISGEAHDVNIKQANNIHRKSKKQDTKLLAITSLNIN